MLNYCYYDEISGIIMLCHSISRAVVQGYSIYMCYHYVLSYAILSCIAIIILHGAYIWYTADASSILRVEYTTDASSILRVEYTVDASSILRVE